MSLPTETTLSDAEAVDDTATQPSTAVTAEQMSTEAEQHAGGAADESLLPRIEAKRMDPAELEIGENVRKNFRLEDYPVDTESIRVHGVKDPILAIRMPDGRIVVRDGQVRTLTALAYEQPRVPVWIVDADTSLDEKEAEIERIFEQITLNDRRVPLTDGDRAGGIALALELGASVTRVSKALQTKRDQVKVARKVGGSETARTLVDDGQFDLEQAAVIADYEAVGDTAAVSRLSKVGRTEFPFEARRIANHRAEGREYFAAALPYAEAGFGVLTLYPNLHGPLAEVVLSSELADADGNPVSDTLVHTDPGRWLVHIELDHRPLCIDRETGAIVEHGSVDWSTERDPDREPREGMRHVRDIEKRDHWTPEYFLPLDQIENARLRHASDTDPAADTAGPADDTHDEDEDELAARRAAAQAAVAEAAEAKRQAARRVRELNKQGVAAKEVRMQFERQLLARKTLPQGADKFIAESLAADSGMLAEYNAFNTTLELLGVTGWRPALLSAVEAATPARCRVIVLALVIGALEKRATKEHWRYADAGVRRLLNFLRDAGYPLVPVDLAAAGELEPDTIDIDTPVTEDDTPQAA
ncbi:ParB family chromosome partitioning protein [Nocardia transvalensis]|uniref:ParB family chromosome partitioning protein n=1 Tax=Nocardia transvalensis TaxID=37333 RepID=A0A7W9PIM1_9NOCA|nr:hypothetical protein [Nocardia transvalensis]MBB5916775.1 ParB family chromosome partitioning protein [Nocardia transvalensis]